MIVKKEYRAERNDVYSFWETKKVLNELDQVEEIEQKIDECTVIMLEGRVAELDRQIADLTAKKQIEQTKIKMIDEEILSAFDGSILPE